MVRSKAILLVLYLVTVTADAALLSRAGGQAYYDTDTDLTWVADANLAQTSGYDADGLMDWSTAVGWAASLNAQNAGLGYLGTNDWRLPTATDTGEPGCLFSSYTGNECGWNVDLTTGEMAHLFYSTLGNSGAYDAGGAPTGCSPFSCLTNDGPFLNLQPTPYWYGTPNFSPAEGGWMFHFNSGFQSGGSFGTAPAWAVHDGDPFAPIPIPPAVYLFGSALGLMGWLRRTARPSGHA